LINKRGDLATINPGTTVKSPLDFIKRNEKQPRIVFNQASLIELANSMKENADVVCPIHVTIRKNANGLYALIVDGERRWRAAPMAGLKSISISIMPPMTDKEIYMASAKANFGRENMSPIEEAYVIINLRNEYGWDQKTVAQELGKSQGFVSNTLKYLLLIEDLQQKLLYGEIDKGIALQLVQVEKEDQQYAWEKVQDICKKYEADKKRKLHPNDAGLLLKKMIESGEVRSREYKKGEKRRDTASLAELTLRGVLSSSENLSLRIKKLKDVSDGQICTEPKIGFFNVQTSLEETRNNINLVLSRFEQLEYNPKSR
jgi:ParB/RepB/Spo0J family partition protein